MKKNKFFLKFVTFKQEITDISKLFNPNFIKHQGSIGDREIMNKFETTLT